MPNLPQRFNLYTNNMSIQRDEPLNKYVTYLVLGVVVHNIREWEGLPRMFIKNCRGMSFMTSVSKRTTHTVNGEDTVTSNTF